MKRIEAPENATKLLVDIRGVLYASYFWARKEYDAENQHEFESAVLFRFFTKLRCAHYYANTNRIIFCCDSATSKRKEIYADYKGKRTKDEYFDRYRAFFLKVQNEILPFMGFKNILTADGLEADDIIASICLQESKLPIVIYSEDGDLYQCLKHNVHMMSIKRASLDNDATIMYPSKFEKLFGIPCSRWAEVKSMAGCTTDNVKGIENVGEGRAIKYLLGELPNGMVKSRIERSADVIEFTKRLVKLPFDGVVIPFTWQPDDFNKDNILKVIEEYSLTSMMDGKFWSAFFGFDQK